MWRASVALLLMILLAGVPARAQTESPGREAALAGGSVAANLFYFPAKFIVASAGLLAGGMTAALTYFDTRSMYAIWVPTVTGTYFLTPAHLEGQRPIEFFGSHYPAAMASETEGESSGVHEARCGTRQ
jgi:hypothetical protein